MTNTIDPGMATDLYVRMRWFQSEEESMILSMFNGCRG
jgi:hypothetical protein